ncbi:MAG: branched-chain amino acid ABC transporter permease [Rhodospirillaceae bacterium]|nr:branched-chain amino acid ABC transporter permease [Rhodospirillaceae bacterium]
MDLSQLPQQIVNGLMLGGVYVMVAVAFTLIIGMLNFLNFTVPALFMLAAVLMWAILEGHGIALDLTAIAVLLVLAMMVADRLQQARLPASVKTVGALGLVAGACVFLWLILSFKPGPAVFAWLDGAVGASGRWLLGIVVAFATVAVLSLLIERFTYRYMKAKYGDATEHALPLVSSLGFLIVIEHTVISTWGSDSLTTESPFGNASFELGPVLFSVPQLLSLILSLAIVFGLSVMLKTTKLGRALRSIAERPDTAPLMGVEVSRIVPVVYVIAGLLCATAGILFTINYTTVDAYIGDTVATVAIAGMVLGGLGNVWGAIVGATLIGMVEVMSIYMVGATFKKIPIWGLLLLILIVRPTGLFGHTAIGKGKF